MGAITNTVPRNWHYKWGSGVYGDSGLYGQEILKIAFLMQLREGSLLLLMVRGAQFMNLGFRVFMPLNSANNLGHP